MACILLISVWTSLLVSFGEILCQDQRFLDLVKRESSKIDEQLSSKCYLKQPNFERSATSWGYGLTETLEVTEKKVVSDPSLCSNLGLCTKLPHWMIEKKGSVDDEQVVGKVTPDEAQAKSYKDVPKKSEDEPLKIYMSFYIESISSFSEVDQEFNIGAFVRYEWNVTIKPCRRYLFALAALQVGNIPYTDFENENADSDLGRPFVVKLASDKYNLFWMPDIFMDNAKSVFNQLSNFEPNYLDVRGIIATQTSPTVCSFSYIKRFGAVIPCSMNFLYYPIDAQHCEMRFRSFEHTSENVKLVVKAYALSVDVMKGLGDQYVNLSGDVGMEEIFGHKYSVISLNLRFQRTMVSAVVGAIVPSLLIVSISFSSFWLGLDYLGDRINIGMICLLAVLAQFSQTRGTLPPTSYVTFMDYWMILCIFSIVAQLLQTTLVYFVYNYRKTQVIKRKDEDEKKEKRDGTFFVQTVTENRPTTARFVGEQLRRRRMSQPIDREDDEYSNIYSANRETFGGEEVTRSAFSEGLIKLEQMLFEPPVKKTSTRYIPMKIDSVTRVLLPSTFIILVVIYWIILLEQKDPKYHVF